MATSTMDELNALESRVRQRLTELQPLVDEFRELEQVAQRLGISGQPPPSTKRNATTPAPAKSARTRRTGRGRGRAAAKAGSAKRTVAAAKAGSAKRTVAAAKATAAAAMANGSGDEASVKSPTRRPRASASAKPAPRDRPSGHGDKLLALVNQRPGITVREVAEQMGVDATSLYRIVRRLEGSGQIKKQGRQLQPT